MRKKVGRLYRRIRSRVDAIPRRKRAVIACIILALLMATIVGAAQWIRNSHSPTSSNPTVVATQKKLPELKKAVASDNNNAQAHYNLASAYYVVGDKIKAKDHYQVAVDKDPQNASYRNNLGNTYRDLEQYDKAVEEYRKAIELEPTHPNAYANLANVQENYLHDTAAALATYDAAIQANANASSSLLLKANALERMNRRSEAKALYQEIVEREPENSAAKAGLVRTE